MVVFVRRIVDAIQEYVFYKADRRTAHYFLTNPYIISMILLSYLAFVRKIGPLLMKNRAPFKLKNILLAFNVLQVIVNTYIFVHGTPIILSFNWRCEEITDTLTDKDKNMLNLGYLYYLTKIVDLMDTVFFVLRKKYNQVTFLHVYHHTLMVIVSLTALKFYAGGHSAYEVYINSFVHAVMYAYYFISSLDEKYRQNVWWKKYITQLQMVQFVITVIVYAQPLLTEGCKYSKFFSALAVSQNVLMFYLFSKFYYKAYIKKQE